MDAAVGRPKATTCTNVSSIRSSNCSLSMILFLWPRHRPIGMLLKNPQGDSKCRLWGALQSRLRTIEHYAGWRDEVDATIYKALVVADNPSGTAYLVRYLLQRGFKCELAHNFEEAAGLVRMCHFELILSPLRLRDDSLLPLAHLVCGTTTALFYFYTVEDGCWWLPAVWHGEQCFGYSAFRPREFACTLNAAIDELKCVQRERIEPGQTSELSSSIEARLRIETQRPVRSALDADSHGQADVCRFSNRHLQPKRATGIKIDSV